MKPYLRANKLFMVQLRSASRLGRLKLILCEFAGDVQAIWRYGSPFPTFVKLLASLLLCLFAILPIVYPICIAVITYFTFESLYLSWWLNNPWLFNPVHIVRRAVTFSFSPRDPVDMWKVREVMTRCILLVHSIATSVDYLCVMQGLLDEA